VIEANWEEVIDVRDRDSSRLTPVSEVAMESFDIDDDESVEDRSEYCM
jgi:hypothetical protein